MSPSSARTPTRARLDRRRPSSGLHPPAGPRRGYRRSFLHQRSRSRSYGPLGCSDRARSGLPAALAAAWPRPGGPPGVYEAFISSHRESPRVQRIRLNEAPEVTGGDSSRQLPITRNEGVPGSSPGVGFSRFAGKRRLAPASAAAFFLEHIPANACSNASRRRAKFAGTFLLRARERLLRATEGLCR